MELTFIREGDFGILRLSGTMEKLPTAELRRGLDLVVEQACPFMIVDLSRVTQLSISGLGLVFAGKSRLEEVGTLMAVVGPKRELNRLLSAESLEKMVPVCESIERAKIALRKFDFDKRRRRRNKGDSGGR